MTTYALEDTTLPDVTVPELPREATLADRFAAFDAENPHVYEALVRYLERDLRDGFSYVSLKFHVEALRRAGVKTTGKPYSIDNSYTRFWAHRVAATRPDLAPLLRIKGQAS